MTREKSANMSVREQTHGKREGEKEDKAKNVH